MSIAQNIRVVVQKVIQNQLLHLKKRESRRTEKLNTVES